MANTQNSSWWQGGGNQFYGNPNSRLGRMFSQQQPKEEAKPPNLSTDLGNLQDLIGGLMPVKGDWQQFEPILGASQGKASELAAEEDRRLNEARQMIARQLAESNRMSTGLTQQEIDMRLGRSADAASESMMQGASSARSMLGQTGVIGGTQAAALEGALRMGRMAHIQSSRTSLAVEEAARRAQAANDAFSRTSTAAAFMSQGPSMLELDQLNSIVDVGMNAFLGERQVQAAKKASSDNKKASTISSLTGLLPLPFKK